MFCRSCSSSYTENNKIGFAFFGFFCELIWILQVAAKNTQRGKKPFCGMAPGKIELFTVMPLVCAKPPGITWDLAMWPSGLGGGPARENPGDLAGELCRGVDGDALGVAGDRFGCSLATERWPAGGHGGGRRRRPLEVRFRRAGCLGWTTSKRGSYRES
jgi:hypothetical protein